MDWPNEIVFEFLEWYESEPVIWNASLPNHKNRNEVYDAWKRIELKMGQKYSVTELKKKKESLMASFRTCLNKVKQSIKSGAGIEDIYKPQWFAYEKMASFLWDKGQPKNIINTEDILSEEGCDNDEVEEEDTARVNSENGGLGWDDIQNDTLMFPLGSKSVFKRHLRKKRKMAEADEPAKKNNVCTIYGELVAAKLHLMDEHTREICMHRIDNILFEMKMNSCGSCNNYHPLYPTQQSKSSSLKS